MRLRPSVADGAGTGTRHGRSVLRTLLLRGVGATSRYRDRYVRRGRRKKEFARAAPVYYSRIMEMSQVARIFAAAIAASIAATSAAIALDQSLPAYQAVPDISGQIKSVGPIR